MGEVFLAQDNMLKRSVALKFLILPKGIDKVERSEAVARFYREAQAAAKLTHSNIVIIHDIDERESRHYISMEYLEGSTLDGVMAQGPLPPEKAADIVSSKMNDRARIIWGCSVEPTQQGTIKVLLIITGAKSKYLMGSGYEDITQPLDTVGMPRQTSYGQSSSYASSGDDTGIDFVR